MFQRLTVTTAEKLTERGIESGRVENGRESRAIDSTLWGHGFTSDIFGIGNLLYKNDDFQNKLLTGIIPNLRH